MPASQNDFVCLNSGPASGARPPEGQGHLQEGQAAEAEEGGGQRRLQERQLVGGLRPLLGGPENRPLQPQDQRKAVLQQSHRRGKGTVRRV